MRRTTKIVIQTVVLVIVSILAAIVYLAYGYIPPEKPGRSSDFQDLGAQYHLVRDLDWRLTISGMEGMRVPTLILWGKEDQYLAVEQLAQLKASMPKIQTQILDECGHSLHEECAKRVNALLIEYLSETQ